MRNNSSTDPRRRNLATFQAPNLALVEGPDEFDFIHFLTRREDLQIHVYEGKNQLRLEIKTIERIAGFDQVKKIIVLRDSDNDPSAALASVLSQWSDALKQKAPGGIQAGDWFTDETGRSWCVWLMPDANSPGDLETLLWRSVQPSDHTGCIDDFLRCLTNCAPVPIGTESKARLYSWLATQREPFKQLHWAFSERENLFDPADRVFADLVQLLGSL